MDGLAHYGKRCVFGGDRCIRVYQGHNVETGSVGLHAGTHQVMGLLSLEEMFLLFGLRRWSHERAPPLGACRGKLSFAVDW